MRPIIWNDDTLSWCVVQRGICSCNGITAGLVTPGKPIDLVQISTSLSLISPQNQRVLLFNTASGLLLLGAQQTHPRDGGASLCDRIFFFVRMRFVFVDATTSNDLLWLEGVWYNITRTKCTLIYVQAHHLHHTSIVTLFASILIFTSITVFVFLSSIFCTRWPSLRVKYVTTADIKTTPFVLVNFQIIFCKVLLHFFVKRFSTPCP